MKLARPLLVFLGIAVVAGGIVAGLALTPAIQRRAVLRAAAGQPGLELGLGRVSAGFSRFSLREVSLRRNGLKVELERLDGRYSLLDLLVRRRLHLRQLTAEGLQVDASRLTPSGTRAAVAGAPAATPGLLGRLQLPFELVLDDINLSGRALLPGAAGRAPVEAGFKLTGGGFAAGREGTLQLAAMLKNPVADAPVASLNTRVSLRATQTAARSFSSVVLTAVVDAGGPGIAEHSQLKITAGLEKQNGGEAYTVSVDTLLRGTTENLLNVQAALAATGRAYEGRWTLKARTAQIDPFFLGGTLPEFDAHGEGGFSLDPATGGINLQGRLEAGVSRLEAIEPAWRAIGPVRLKARFDVAETAGLLRLNELGVALSGAAPVLELTATGAAEFNLKDRRLQVGGNAEGEVLRLSLPGLPLAWVRPFVSAADISGGMITGEFVVTAGKDRLVARSTAPLRIDTVSVVDRGQLLVARAGLAFNAEAVLTAQDVALRMTGLTVTTPAGDTFSAEAGVTFPLAANPPFAVTANYHADLPTLLAPWLPLGHIKAAGEADFTLADGKIELRGLNATVTDAGGLTLFQAAALRPFSLDLATRRAVTAAGSGSGQGVDLLRITLGRLPLDRLPLGQAGAKLGGVVEQGVFVLAAEGDRLTGRAVSPLRLADVSLAQDGRPALAGLTVEMAPAFELNSRTSAQVRTGDVIIRTASGASLLTLKGETTRTSGVGLRGSLDFNLELPALSSQPLFAGAESVTSGRATGEFRAALGRAGSQVEARMTLNGLVARDDGQTLPVANLSFQAVAAGNGSISVQAPLLLDRDGQRSDLNFALELTPAGRSFALDGRLTGDRVELADALAVLGVFLATAEPGRAGAEPSAPAPRVVADTAPAWARFTGRLLLDIKSVTSGADWTMTGLTGLVTLDPAKVSLGNLAAAFGEKSRFDARGGVRFTGGAKPYVLEGDFSLTEFDAGSFFKALEPAKPATVEGLFGVQGRFAGDGETLARTFEHARGAFELTGRQGVFRGLQRTSGKVSMTSKAVELGASVLGSLFGSEKVTKAAEKVAGTAYFVDQLALSLGEINYDLLGVKLTRGESLDVTLEEISLVAPEIRLIGRGTITHVADRPLLQQPLTASLSLAGRGKTEELLGKLRLLTGARDDLGYARTRETLTLGGTLVRPDPTAFFTRIASAKLGELLAPEN